MFEKHRKGAMTPPNTVEVMVISEFVERYVVSSQPVQFIVHSSRRYGQPKLSKPSELKGVAQIFSTQFTKNCKCPCFIAGNDLWIKHRDWNSEEIYNYQEADIPAWRRKFIYNDFFGCVVLRGEAWLRIANIVNAIKDEHPLTAKEAIIEAMAAALSIAPLDLCIGDWERFFDSIISQIRKFYADGVGKWV